MITQPGFFHLIFPSIVVLPMIAVCFLLAALLHADMNSGSLNPGAHKQGQASLKDGNNI